MNAVGVNRIGPLMALVLLLTLTPLADGAILSSTPAPEVVAGSQFLTAPSGGQPASLGLPSGGAWALNALYWGQAGDVSVQASIDENGIASPFGELVFFTIGNIGAQDWTGFEIELEGNGVFSQIAPTGIDRASSTPVVSGDGKRLTISGTDWPEGDQAIPTASNLSFGLNLTPVGPDETINLTFRPIPVPEPSSGLLILAGSAMIVRRRR